MMINIYNADIENVSPHLYSKEYNHASIAKPITTTLRLLTFCDATQPLQK